MAHEITEVRIDEDGTETHESWVVARANRMTVSPPGQRLFDSEINHTRLITVEIARCSRRRRLKQDWLHSEQLLVRMEMSEAQWGAFVSSFGDGTGVPATLAFLTNVAGPGHVPQAPFESRLDESFREVRAAGDEALTKIEEDYAKVLEAFENGGRKALREALRTLGFSIENGPKNMEYAAKSLAEHVENVVTKARADIEAMVASAGEQGALPSSSLPQLGRGT